MDSATRRVLVVDDNAQVLAVVGDLLTRNGYQVLEARNGVEAMAVLTGPSPETPDAMILDLSMPLQTGISVLEFLRNVLSSGLPVIVLSGSADPQHEREVRALGVSHFLRKPAPSQQILAALSQALPGSRFV